MSSRFFPPPKDFCPSPSSFSYPQCMASCCCACSDDSDEHPSPKERRAIEKLVAVGLTQAPQPTMRPLAGPPIASPVNLNIYDLVSSDTNRKLSACGFGVFHTGVIIYGIEWSYGESSESGRETGLFAVNPGQACGTLSQTLYVGETGLSPEQVDTVLHRLENEWRSDDYHLLHRNCNHFAEYFCRLLSTNPRAPISVPTWCNRLARWSDKIVPQSLATYVLRRLDGSEAPPKAKPTRVETNISELPASVIPRGWYAALPSMLREPRFQIMPAGSSQGMPLSPQRAVSRFSSRKLLGRFDDSGHDEFSSILLPDSHGGKEPPPHRCHLDPHQDALTKIALEEQAISSLSVNSKNQLAISADFSVHAGVEGHYAQLEKKCSRDRRAELEAVRLEDDDTLHDIYSDPGEQRLDHFSGDILFDSEHVEHDDAVDVSLPKLRRSVDTEEGDGERSGNSNNQLSQAEARGVISGGGGGDDDAANSYSISLRAATPKAAHRTGRQGEVREEDEKDDVTRERLGSIDEKVLAASTPNHQPVDHPRVESKKQQRSLSFTQDMPLLDEQSSIPRGQEEAADESPTAADTVQHEVSALHYSTFSRLQNTEEDTTAADTGSSSPVYPTEDRTVFTECPVEARRSGRETNQQQPVVSAAQPTPPPGLPDEPPHRHGGGAGGEKEAFGGGDGSPNSRRHSVCSRDDTSIDDSSIKPVRDLVKQFDSPP